jgi:hypothetical protein
VLDDPVLASAYELTPLSFAAFPHTRWRGTIDVEVEIVSSVFHRGTIVFLYDPTGFVPSVPPYLRYVSVLQHWTIDINGHTRKTISLPWKQMTAFQGLNKPSGVDADFNYQNTNGAMWCFLLNPITTNGSTDPVQFNIYFSSPDMKFGQQYVHSANQPQPVIIPSAGFAEGEGEGITLTAGKCDDDNFFYKFFGEEHAHTVKELGNRQTARFRIIQQIGNSDPISRQTWTISSGPSYVAPTAQGGGITAGVTADYHITLIDFLSMAYVGVRGSYDYSFFPNGGEDGKYRGATVHQAPVGVNDQYFLTTGTVTQILPFDEWTGFSHAYTPINPSLPFTVPYYYDGLFRPTYNSNFGTGDGFVIDTSIDRIPAGTDNGTNSILYKGGGDDFMFVGFRGVPVTLYP